LPTTRPTGWPARSGRRRGASAASRRAAAPRDVWINDYNVYVPQAEWGGFKQSGIGRELGPSGLDEYREAKHIWQNTRPARPAGSAAESGFRPGQIFARGPRPAIGAARPSDLHPRSEWGRSAAESGPEPAYQSSHAYVARSVLVPLPDSARWVFDTFENALCSDSGARALAAENGRSDACRGRFHARDRHRSRRFRV
jgi:hypothetical protein